MLRSVYEAALPAALKADGILHNQQLTMQRGGGGAPDTIEPQRVEKSAHENIIKLKSLKSLKVLFSVSLAITRESAALCQGSVSTRSSPEGVSWMDILQSNLNFEKEDSAVDVSMQGVFLSDFILLYGGKDVESIVRRSFDEDSWQRRRVRLHFGVIQSEGVLAASGTWAIPVARPAFPARRTVLRQPNLA